MKKAGSTVILFICAIIWGTSFVAQVSSRELAPLSYNGLKYLLGAISLIPVIFIFEKGNIKKEKLDITVKGGILSGIILCVASNLQQIGIYYGTQAGKAGFFTGLYIIIVPVFAFIFLKKKTTPFSLVGAVLAIAGLYMLLMTDIKSFSAEFSDLLVILGAFFWALHIVAIDYFTGKGVNSLVYSAIQFASCAVITVICALVCEKIRMQDVFATKIEILYGGIMSVGVAYTLQVIGQKRVDPSVGAIILSTESVFSVIAGMLILNERLVFPYGYIGCIIMFAAIIISQITPKKTIESITNSSDMES